VLYGFPGGAAGSSELLLAAVWIAPLRAQEPTNTIRGRVTDEASQLPLRGATVTVGSRSTQTRADGGYLLDGIPAGTDTVWATMIGHAPIARAVTVVDGQTVDVDFALTAQAVNLAEMVVVGNGEQRLGNITGAVTNVTAEEFNTGRVVTPTELIQTRSRAYKSWRTTSRVGAPRSGFAVHRRPPRAMNEVHAEFFEDHRPARSTVAVASLPRGARVEIEAVAALP
jgi:hypothetical protein